MYKDDLRHKHSRKITSHNEAMRLLPADKRDYALIGKQLSLTISDTMIKKHNGRLFFKSVHGK